MHVYKLHKRSKESKRKNYIPLYRKISKRDAQRCKSLHSNDCKLEMRSQLFLCILTMHSEFAFLLSLGDGQGMAVNSFWTTLIR